MSSDGAVRLITRGGLDWTKRYGDLPEAFRRLPCREAIIDGEVVVLDEKGISRFGLLQDALSEGAGNKLVFYAFDLLYLDGWDLAAGAARQTQGAAAPQLLSGHATGRSAIQLSDHVEGDGGPLYERASELGLEGIVSKRASATYQSGRSKTWTKTKALSDRRLRHRRLHHLPGGGRARRACPWRMGRRRAALSRQGRHRLRQRHCAHAA